MTFKSEDAAAGGLLCIQQSICCQAKARDAGGEAIKFISSASVLTNTLYTRPPLILMILVGHASPRCLLSSTISRSENFINNLCHEKEEGTDKERKDEKGARDSQTLDIRNSSQSIKKEKQEVN